MNNWGKYLLVFALGLWVGVWLTCIVSVNRKGKDDEKE